MDPEAIVLHQVHPLKVAADVSASIISNTLLWRHQLVSGLVVRYLLPIAGSALVLTFADVSKLSETAAGRYVLAHMPPAAQAIRLLGDVVMLVGSWRRNPLLIVAGLAIVLVGWSHGLLPHAPTAARAL